MSAPQATVAVEGLRIVLRDTEIDIVDEVSFTIAPGEVLGLVGESGSGKTTVGLALLGHTRRGAAIAAGSIRVGDVDILALSGAARRSVRGRLVSYVPQDPAASLNPALRIGTQLRETLEVHGFGAGAEERSARIAEVMREVALPDDPAYLRRYPHELSGGQQQRIGLAMAFACRPRLIVLDEPTTGLDVTTQAHVLGTVRELAAAHHVAALYVSHDLAVVGTLATRTAVMYAGRIVELGPTAELFASASHPYTRRLVQAIPHLSGRRELIGIPGRAPSPGARPQGCTFAPRCTFVIDACRRRGAAAPPARRRPLGQVHPRRGGACERRLAARAGSRSTSRRSASATPCSRSTTSSPATAPSRSCTTSTSSSRRTSASRWSASRARARPRWPARSQACTGIARASSPCAASRSPRARAARTREARQAIQYVFQNPYGSLNPRKTIGQIVRQPLGVFGAATGAEADARVTEMLERVSLAESYLDRYPDQLSGGERQRVAIARALVVSPSVLVCDEVTSALDVSVQAAIVELLAELQRELGLAMLFVTHNLPLVRSIAQRVAVMSSGRIVELGTVEHVLQAPSDDYTQRLLADTPSLETATA